MEEKHNWLGPYMPEGNLFREVIQQIKLAYNLILDPRVRTKQYGRLFLDSLPQCQVVFDE